VGFRVLRKGLLGSIRAKEGGFTMKCECGNEIRPRTGMGMPGVLYDYLCSLCADKQKWSDFLMEASQ